jgi:hypothetical protein
MSIPNHHLSDMIATKDVQPGQFITLFLQDHPKELAQVSDFGSMFWGLVLKTEDDVNDEGEPIWVLTLMLENGVSIIHRRRNEKVYIAVEQPSEFGDPFINGKIGKLTGQIEALEAQISRLKGVQAAVHTS